MTRAACSPGYGLSPATGGNQVAITGTGFTGATAVAFGGTAATFFTVTSGTSITAVVPAGTRASVTHPETPRHGGRLELFSDAAPALPLAP
ncbi:IPT/TIG domain-containing protein, partial [Streptomyces termitum]